MHHKTVANGFWNHEVEQELHEQGKGDFLFQRISDREKAMSKIDKIRATTIYECGECFEECRRRGTCTCTLQGYMDIIIEYSMVGTKKVCAWPMKNIIPKPASLFPNDSEAVCTKGT